MARRPLVARRALAVLALVALALPAAAQLTDLQPGRNFPTSTSAFGTGRSDNIDVGDIDNDGDGDVAVANGGDGAPQANTLHVNQGGLQGGAPGAFVDETAARLAGAPVDTSRDIELADVDGDGDLDIFVGNRGTTTNGGEVSRAYVNQGGAQLGSVGFFSEGTEGFWGELVSIPPEKEEGEPDGFGPWRGHVWDADFADVDDDGDLDVFLASAGPNLSANDEQLVFLNDGGGRFHELFPWADAAANITLRSHDADLADLDGDFDLDIVAASQGGADARIYRNNRTATGWPGDPFTDVTQTALLATGAGAIGGSNYEVEIGDVDGDGDFDLWMSNYDNFEEDVLRNDGGLTFSKKPWIVGDPEEDDHDIDFTDYDGDGDLDAVLAAHSAGTVHLYVNGLAQGLDPESHGLFHRSGTPLSLATWPETAAGPSVVMDVEEADLDRDGDPDLLLGRESFGNRLWWNALGVPDTHAPSLHQVTQQDDKADGSDTVIHAQLRDNSADYTVAAYDVRLFYSVDGGLETCLLMAPQGGMQFRAVIPGGHDGTIAYRVEATDLAGNTGLSATTSYEQESSGITLWQSVDCGTPGVYGPPALSLAGSQIGGEPLTLRLRDAAPGALFLLWLATPASTPLPALGGTVHAFPASEQFLLGADGGGLFVVTLSWPPGLPAGIDHYWQVLVADASNPYGIALSNAVKGTTP